MHGKHISQLSPSLQTLCYQTLNRRFITGLLNSVNLLKLLAKFHIERCSSRKKVCGFHPIVSSVRAPKIKWKSLGSAVTQTPRVPGLPLRACQAFSVELRLFLTTRFSVQSTHGPGSRRRVLAQLGVQLTFSKDLLFLTGHSDRCVRLVEAPLKSRSVSVYGIATHILDLQISANHTCRGTVAKHGAVMPYARLTAFSWVSPDGSGCRSSA